MVPVDVTQSNAFFEGDALTLLERLPSESLTLVYLDPPWKSGGDFERAPRGSSRAPEHEHAPNVDEHAINLSKVVQQVRRILRPEGSLVVQWSQTSPIDVRLVMNQAFERQPSYEITWHRKMPGVAARKGPKIDSEFLLVYAKSDRFIYNTILRPLSPGETSPYSLSDPRGPYRVADLTAPIERPSAQYPWRGYTLPPKRSWRFTMEKLESLIEEGRIYFPPSGGQPRLKQYLADSQGVEIGTTWDDIQPVLSASRKRTGYPGQKPLALLRRIIELTSNPGDRVLDPFCGSGTTLVAAESSSRKWWGADSSEESRRTVLERLRSASGLEPEKEYAVLSASDVAALPVIDNSYKDVVANIEGIARLQQDVAELTDHLLSLKRLMNIAEDDEQGIEKAIQEMEHWIATSIARQSVLVDSYVDVVRTWLAGWQQLDKASQAFLPQAEMLFDNIARACSKDYSPFIIQYCRALENELLKKIFAAYADDLHGRRGSDLTAFLAKDLKNDKLQSFAKALNKHESTYTLGQMHFIMGLMKEGGQTLAESPVLQDFRTFTVRYFSERIVEKAYLDQIDRINKDFRCKAAHPYVLDLEVAERCREQVRTCLNELILNYKGNEPGPQQE